MRKNSKHYTIDEMKFIEISLKQNQTYAMIAKTLQRDPSTIWRHVKRYSVDGVYTAEKANDKRQMCRAKAFGRSAETILHKKNANPLVFFPEMFAKSLSHRESEITSQIEKTGDYEKLYKDYEKLKQDFAKLQAEFDETKTMVNVIFENLTGVQK